MKKILLILTCLCLLASCLTACSTQTKENIDSPIINPNDSLIIPANREEVFLSITNAKGNAIITVQGDKKFASTSDTVMKEKITSAGKTFIKKSISTNEIADRWSATYQTDYLLKGADIIITPSDECTFLLGIICNIGNVKYTLSGNEYKFATLNNKKITANDINPAAIVSFSCENKDYKDGNVVCINITTTEQSSVTIEATSAEYEKGQGFIVTSTKPIAYIYTEVINNALDEEGNLEMLYADCSEQCYVYFISTSMDEITITGESIVDSN